MESDKLNMDLQYFADAGQAGSQSQPGAQGGSNGEGGQSTNNNSATNPVSQNDQSANDFIKSLVDTVTQNSNQNQSNQNTNSNSNPAKQNANDGEPTNTDAKNNDTDDGKTFTQAEVDKLLKDREFRAHKKGIEEGKKAGKSSAEKYAQMTDERSGKRRSMKFLKRMNNLKLKKIDQTCAVRCLTSSKTPGISLPKTMLRHSLETIQKQLNTMLTTSRIYLIASLKRQSRTCLRITIFPKAINNKLPKLRVSEKLLLRTLSETLTGLRVSSLIKNNK